MMIDLLKNTSRRALQCACILFMVAPPLASGGGFALRVNDVSGLDEPWPMIGGLPFPEGALSDPSQIRVVDADGREVPTQIDVVATWNDGSIRWAQAGINASPQGEYRVEFGPGVSRSEPATPLRVERDDDGGLSVDTGVAVFEFPADGLLPQTARMNDTVVLEGSGDGAYLIDNRGRLARVAGEAAEIETELLKEGPGRVVVRREGWYVTDDGERVARAKAWFYLTAGSPYLRVTHTLVFTEDTNELWVRDYGLEFRTPEAPGEVVFALGEATEADRFIGGTAPEDKLSMMAEMFSHGLAERDQSLFAVAPGGDEVYMLQENYPHVLEREFRAVVGRATPFEKAGAAGLGNLWLHPWLVETEVAGDWGEARYEDYSLMLVMPQLAQRFPKEIAFSPKAARVAFWSGRSGRELDFRTVTLVNEYWKDWTHNAHRARRGLGAVERGPMAATALAQQPGNAQGAARTHDVWLLPHTGEVEEAQLKARATAAGHPPLLQSDPSWLGSSKAVGWAFHPEDPERFPEIEEVIADYWTQILANRFGNSELRRTGFILWGKNVTLGHGVRFFRLSQGAGHYGLDRSAWMLYMRSGNRPYYDYARHFTRFGGDLSVSHWTAGDKLRGGFGDPNVDFPIYWGTGSRVGGRFWTFGWLMEYYLTGDEYAHELLEMVADSYREKPPADIGSHGHLYNLSMLYELTGDEQIRQLAQEAAHSLIDLENPVGLNDDIRYGVYYKTSTEWLCPLYLYYNATGDEDAKEAILRALDDKLRFFYSSNQTVRLFLLAEAYNWTGNPAYLRLINLMMESRHLGLMGHNFFHGAPVALRAIAEADQTIDPFPVLAATRYEHSVVNSDFSGVIMDHEFIEDEKLPAFLVDKEAGEPVELSVFVRLSDEVDETTEPQVVVSLYESGDQAKPVDHLQVEKQQRFQTRNPGRWHPRRWHFYLSLPEESPAGIYRIEFPDSATIVVLESNVEEIRWEQ